MVLSRVLRQASENNHSQLGLDANVTGTLYFDLLLHFSPVNQLHMPLHRQVHQNAFHQSKHALFWFQPQIDAEYTLPGWKPALNVQRASEVEEFCWAMVFKNVSGLMIQQHFIHVEYLTQGYDVRGLYNVSTHLTHHGMITFQKVWKLLT
jgi:hypothetical protein